VLDIAISRDFYAILVGDLDTRPNAPTPQRRTDIQRGASTWTIVPSIVEGSHVAARHSARLVGPGRHIRTSHSMDTLVQPARLCRRKLLCTLA
jgi:hypothetical protein